MKLQQAQKEGNNAIKNMVKKLNRVETYLVNANVHIQSYTTSTKKTKRRKCM